MEELFLTNGKLHTQDPEYSPATGVAIRGNRFWAVGDDDEIRALAPSPGQVIDLEGRRVLPGLQDAHFHLRDWALGLTRLSLAETRSLGDLRRSLAERVGQVPAGGWVLGQGWNESHWPEPRLPGRADLDDIAPHQPVALWRSDLHLVVANSEALRKAGIDSSTPDPPGGVIDHEASGQPSGVLRELAIDLLTAVVPQPTEEETTDALRQGIPLLEGLGLTGVHDYRLMDGADGPPAFRAYQRLRAAGELDLRVWMHLSGAHLDQAVALGLRSGFGDGFLRVGHVKLFADGGQGARTAWMLEPYADTGGYGLPLQPMAELAEAIEKANRAGLSVAVHTIGDRAIREVLAIIERRSDQGGSPPRKVPNRLEHVQNIRPEDVARMAALDLVASVQPIHIVDDMAMVEQSVGPRGRFTYAFRDLLDAGVSLALGSDCPVADPNPWWGIQAAVTRQGRDGGPEGGWYPAQRLTVPEAVWGITMGPALASGRSRELGSITPGKLADLVVLDRDILSIEPAEIADAQVVMTILDGRVVYER